MTVIWTSRLQQLSMLQKLIKWSSGRHTLAAVWFALTGLGLAWFHRLDGNYVALCVALQGYILVHSGKEDYFASKGPTVGGLNQ